MRANRMWPLIWNRENWKQKKTFSIFNRFVLSLSPCTKTSTQRSQKQKDDDWDLWDKLGLEEWTNKHCDSLNRLSTTHILQNYKASDEQFVLASRRKRTQVNCTSGSWGHSKRATVWGIFAKIQKPRIIRGKLQTDR